MQIQLTIPTKISGKELVNFIKKIKNYNKVLIGDWESEKVLRFEIKDETSRQNIQLSSNKANITFESNALTVKIAIELLKPLFKLLSEEEQEYNFLRFPKITPKEFLSYEDFKIENPEEKLIELINIFGIPNGEFNKKLLEAVIKSGDITIKDFKNFLREYNDPSIPKCYIEILKKILDS